MIELPDMDPPSQGTPPRRIRFDPTINAGHILTALTFLVAGFGAYASLAIRVTVLESSTAASAVASMDRDKSQNESIALIRNDIKDVERALSALTIAVVKDTKR